MRAPRKSWRFLNGLSATLGPVLGAVVLSSLVSGCRAAEAPSTPPPPRSSTASEAAPRGVEAPLRAAAGPGAVDGSSKGPRGSEKVVSLLVAELDQPDPNRSWRAAVELLRYYARHGGEAGAEGARAALLERVEKGPPEQQRAILKALGEFFALPPERIDVPGPVLAQLLPLAIPALKSAKKEVARQAERTLAALDKELPAGRAALDVELKRILDPHRSPAAVPQELVAVVRLLGARRPTSEAPLKREVGTMIELLTRYSVRARKEQYKDVVAAVLRELHGLTGWRFEDVWRARVWWSQNGRRSPLEWYRASLEQTEEEVTAAQGAARDWWRRYIASINADQDRLLAELKRSVLEAAVPQVRAEAVRELARLAARPEESAERVQTVYRALISALDPNREKAPVVLRAILETMVEQPPRDPRLLEAARRAASRTLKAVPDREVRLLAIRAVGRLQATGPDTMVLLYGVLQQETPDGDLATAALEALSRIGAKNNPAVLREVVAFLGRETGRAEDDPQRDVGLVQTALSVIAALGRRGEIAQGWEETTAAVALSSDLLLQPDPAVRQLAAEALAGLKHPAALSLRRKLGAAEVVPILHALSDADVAVARFAAAAIGAIASSESATEASRKVALEALIAAAAKNRKDVTDAVLKSVALIARGDPKTGLPPLRDLARRLAENAGDAKDYARLAGLLKDVPATAPPGVEQGIVDDLRVWYAHALLRTGGGEREGALAILEAAAKNAARFRGPFADALLVYAQTSQELQRADGIYAALLAEGGDPAVLWVKRVKVVEALLRTGGDARAATLCREHLRTKDLPASARGQLEALEKRLSAAGAKPPKAPESPKTGGRP